MNGGVGRLEDAPVPINGEGFGQLPGIGGYERLPADDGIEGANSLNDLFNAVDQMKFEYIAGFDDMAAGLVPGQPLEQQEIHKRLGGGDRKLEEDFSYDLIKLANNILDRLKGVSVWLQQAQAQKADVPQFTDAIDKVLQQLVDNKVYICVLGRYNVGKTTLINALLRNEILPVNISPETAITLYIQHDDKLIDASVRSPQPRLINCSNSSLVAQGVEDVKRELKKLHRCIRHKSVGSDDNYYLLKIDFPLLSVEYEGDGKKDPVPLLVDTPGSNEVGEAQLQVLAEQNLKSAAAYIFVMKYDDIKNKEDYAALRMIYNRDPSIFQSERLTIVVTHYDIAYQNSQSHMTVKAVKETVSKTISQVINADVSNDIIIPICGKLANDVRLCQSNPKMKCNDVQMSLISIKSFESAESDLAETSQEVFAMQKNDMLKAGERYCMIEELEKRIKLVSTRLFSVWKKNIVGSCSSFLESLSQNIDDVLSQVERDVKDINDQISHAITAVDHHRVMLESIKRESPVLTKLRDSFAADINYEVKFDRKIENLLVTLQQTLTEKKRVRKYSISQLTEEVNSSFQTDAMAEIQKWFMQTKFENCQRVLRVQTQRVSEKFGRFRAAAAMVVEHGGIPQTMASFFEGNEVAGEGNGFDEVLESKLRNLEQANLSTIIHKTYSIRMMLPLIRANVLNEENTVDQLVENRRTAIRELHRKFFNDVQDHILLYFFKMYVGVVIKELNIFERLLEREGGHEKVLDSYKRKGELAPKQQLKKDCVALQSHFKRLTSKLDILSRQQ